MLQAAELGRLDFLKHRSTGHFVSFADGIYHEVGSVWAQVPRSHVLQIDRVQNLRLWTKYIMRRSEVIAHMFGSFQH
jgi:hypothetical protein